MRKHRKNKGLFDEQFRRDKIATKDPLEVLSTKVNWEQFRPVLESAFVEYDPHKGGRPSFDRVMMFKVLVLAEYYGLSDDQIEYQILDRLSFQKFIGQGFEDIVPDAKTIWLFRQKLMKAQVIDKIFQLLTTQLERYGLVAKKGVIVDASFIHVPIQRNTLEENETIKNGDIPEEWEEEKRRQKDTDARWTKKNNTAHYGYKQHVKTDLGSKLITSFEITTASVHDSQVFEELLDEQDKGQAVYADSAYYSEEIIRSLTHKGFAPMICEKGYTNKPLTKAQKRRNKRKSRKRSRGEHVFAWLQNKGRRLIRGIGLDRITARATLRIIGYNLDRAVFLIGRRGTTVKVI